MKDELYDLENDPEEVEDLSSGNGNLVMEMGAELKIRIDQSVEG